MLLDARTLDTDALDADLCIIGAGAAGITLALELAGSGIGILLLESGGLEPDDATQALDAGVNDSPFAFELDQTRLRWFGGTTNHWGGFTPRLTADDLARGGWPIAYADLARHYPRAEDLCQLGAARVTDPAAASRRLGIPPLALPAGDLRIAGVAFSPPTRFGDVYRPALRRAGAVRVLLHANVLDLQATPEAGRITHARVGTLSGRRFAVRARAFVIAAGGIETARLLLLSRAQAPAGLGNGHDLVGRHFMDHPGTNAATLMISPHAPDLRYLMDMTPTGDSILGGVLVPAPDLPAREGIGNFRVQLSPTAAPPEGVTAAQELAHDPAAWRDVGRHLADVLMDLDQVANVAWKSLIDRRGFLAPSQAAPGRGYALAHVSAEQTPNPDSRVTLDTTRDAFGLPRVRVAWRLLPRDYATLRRAAALFAASAGANGLGRAHIPADLARGSFPNVVQIACHHSGTARMSRTPAEGVVDADLRVHGIANLFIASSAVFPSIGWQNPTLTIVALAVRLAGHLRGAMPALAAP